MVATNSMCMYCRFQRTPEQCSYFDGLKIICYSDNSNPPIDTITHLIDAVTIEVWTRLGINLDAYDFSVRRMWKSEQIKQFQEIVNKKCRFHVAHIISTILFIEYGFSGDTVDYYSPLNSLLHKVVERKKGKPLLHPL